MIIKNFKKFAALGLCISLGISSTTFALSNPDSNETKNPEKKIEDSRDKRDCKDKKDCEETKYKNKHRNFIDPTTMKELGLTIEDIRSAKESGKTLFDIAKEKKGLSEKEVREIIIKNKTEKIKKKVDEGKIPKEKADDILLKMRSNVEKWDGSLNSSRSDKETSR
ncbi:hypothetical protein [uncultured Clostridium sp.]|uniref:hypothetical protein n=1 Tax=uncultured Clostridium sp. TaxID=59620 RepID=UPI0028E6C1D5|nr:hypothetical protein [uncultured Clostridium sp.]